MTLETRASYSLPSHLEGDGRRLNQQHEVFRLLLPSFSLLLTPLPPGYSGKVLDVGTGTGIWATEFAAENPQSQVDGVDLFLPSASAGPNCTLAVLDVESPLAWSAVIPSDTYDLIHSRMCLMTLRDARSAVHRIFSALKPGGIVEFQEKQDPYRTDDPSPEAQDTPLLVHSRQRIEAAKLCGLDRTVAAKIPGWMEEVGFVDVVVVEKRIPIGGWWDRGSEEENARLRVAGEKFKECLEWGTLGIARDVFRLGYGWDEEQIRENVKGAVEDLGNGQVYAAIMFITGRKPEA